MKGVNLSRLLHVGNKPLIKSPELLLAESFKGDYHVEEVDLEELDLEKPPFTDWLVAGLKPWQVPADNPNCRIIADPDPEEIIDVDSKDVNDDAKDYVSEDDGDEGIVFDYCNHCGINAPDTLMIPCSCSVFCYSCYKKKGAGTTLCPGCRQSFITCTKIYQSGE